MNTVKLKNIVIAILALLNACLLFLLLFRTSTTKQDYERTVAQLVTLYESGDIRLSPDTIPHSVSLPEVQPQRDTDAERRLAEALLGETLSIDASGGIYRYETDNSSCVFRGSGSVEALLSRPVESPAAFCRDLGEQFGYGDFREAGDPSALTVSAVRMLDGIPVHDCVLSFRFRENTLISVTGSFLSLPDAFERYSESDPITALVNFFDYRSASGVVCTEITGIRCGYLLERSSSGSQRLLRAVRIDTDVNSYCVLEQSGEVLRLS